MRTAAVGSALLAALVLVAAASSAGEQRITMRVHPTIVQWGELVEVSGTIDTAKLNESVDIRVKDCGQSFFRGRAGASTTADGSWWTAFYPGINTILRASWNGNESAEIRVWQVAGVFLYRYSPQSFKASAVGVGGTSAPFWRKRVRIQLRRSGAWKTVREVVLTENSVRGTEFGLDAPKGTLLRAVLPRSQARPCYLAGVSRTLRA